MSMESFTFRRDGRIIWIESHLPGKTNVIVVVSDLELDCSYNIWRMEMTSIEEAGVSIWVEAVGYYLWERLKDNPSFKGFRCKIFNALGKLIVWQDFPLDETRRLSPQKYITDTFDGGGPSYADFFFTDLLEGMNFSGVVVDAGGNSGFFTLKALKEGAHRVYYIEPDPSPFYYTNLNFSSDPRVTLINKALSTDTKPLSFWISDSGSVANSAVYKMPDSSSVTVESIDLPTILSVESRISLLKLDVEGTEYEIMRSLDDSHFKQVDQWFIEYHMGPQDIEEILQSRGYIISFRHISPDEQTGYIWAHR